MSEQEFIEEMKKYGFVQDKEFDGLYSHPNDSFLCTWYNTGGIMAISHGMEYTTHHIATKERIKALYDLLK